MNTKRMLGIIALIVGLGLTTFALYARHKINAAKGDVEGISSFLPENAAGGAARRTLSGEVSKYDTLVSWSLAGGIILIVIGLGSMVYFRKR